MTIETESLPALPFQQWLMSLPEDSQKRLRVINQNTASSKHVILSLTFGLYDGHIRKLNRMITSLLIARLKAERYGNSLLVARINNFMEDMHEAIDQATGTGAVKHARGSPCNRTIQAHLAR